ncbi:MAG: glycoside hydrolase family 2 TIM barrel-domain containing protein [Terracidiphilus sp.]
MIRSRRQFLRDASISAAVALVSAPIRAIAIDSLLPKDGAAVSPSRLDLGWLFRQGPMDSVKEAWAPAEEGLWKSTELPHCFNGRDACDPDQPYFRGQGWYRTRLPLSNPFTDGRTILHFQGAGQTTTLWVGSSLVGTHKGGYDEFAFDITEAVRQLSSADVQQGVPIVVCCDNSTDHDRVPSDLSDFCLFGGLYRHVNLVYLPAVAVDSAHVLATVEADGAARIRVAAKLYNPVQLSNPCTLAIEVSDFGGRTVHQSTQTLAACSDYAQVADFTLKEPELWSPDSPHLYRCRVTLSNPSGQTSITERFGIRHLEFVEHGPFKLNGKRVLLRGTQRHADHAGVAAAMTDDLVHEEMRLIREMGANFIRLAHYQQDRLVLDLCDELGLMVWEEVPWCRAGIGNEAFQQNAKDMLSHMIEQHYNHPSIILWGLGNEDDWPNEYPDVDQQAIRRFMTEMRDLAHRLDASRLTSFRRCDFARDIPDVYSPSIWAGWYRGNYREYEQSLLKERDRVKRFIHIEWGADSQAGRHAEDPETVLRKVPTGNGTDERELDYLRSGGDLRVSKDGDWSETYACNLFDWYLKTQEKLDWLTGSAQWIFKDFASPLREDNAIPRVNQKGVVERDLTRKESYYVFQSFWAQKPMVHIYGHSWPVRGGKQGEQRSVRVYSNCDHVELFLNGKTQGIMHRDSQDFPAAGLRWQVVFAPGPNVLRAIATKGSVTLADEIETTLQTESWGAPAKLQLAEKARTRDLITVEARLIDSAGIHCLDSAKTVRFSLTGAGTLIDNLGTTRGSRELELSNGRAEISFVREGTCRIEARPQGLPSASLEFP